MAVERVGVYPGTFDPINKGHSDIILRSTKLVDRLIIGVARNAGKGPLFSIDERVQIVRDEVEALNGQAVRVEVRPFDNLLMDFVVGCGAKIIIRGLRAVSDFEYEFQMALMNRRLDPEVETVFLTPKEELSYLSSRLVKEVHRLGGDVSGLVPSLVYRALREKLPNGTAG